MARSHKKNMQRNTSGSALISAVMIITVLVVLGMGLLALSTVNLKQAKIDNTYERDYYVAEGGAKQGVEAVKNAALESYRQISADIKNGIQTNNNATSFFSALDAVTYVPPQPDSSAGGPTSDTVTISHATVDSDTHRYTVLSTSTDGKTSRSITGTIDINFVPVTGGFMSFGNQAMISGTNISCQQSTVNITGDVRAASYTIDYPNNFRVSGSKIISSAIPSWVAAYSDHYEAKTAAGLTISPVANGSTVSSGSFPGNSVPQNTPIYIDGVSGASYTVSGINATSGGQFYSTGALTVTNGNYGGTSASNYLKLYSSGNMSVTNSTIKYIKIFCGGNLTISGCSFPDNLIIDCAGSVTITSASLSNVKIFTGSTLTFNQSSAVGNSIVCAQDDITFSNASGTMQGLFYSGSDITINQASMNLDGQIVAAGNIKITQASPQYTYDANLLNTLEKDPFVTGGANTSIIVPPDSQIFTNASAFAEQ